MIVLQLGPAPFQEPAERGRRSVRPGPLGLRFCGGALSPLPPPDTVRLVRASGCGVAHLRLLQREGRLQGQERTEPGQVRARVRRRAPGPCRRVHFLPGSHRSAQTGNTYLG